MKSEKECEQNTFLFDFTLKKIKITIDVIQLSLLSLLYVCTCFELT